MEQKLKYPIFIPSRKRAGICKTTKLLDKFNIPYKLVVEDIDFKNYAKAYGTDKVLKLHGSNYGGVYYARNFIKQYCAFNKIPKHWQLDDDISSIYQHLNGKKVSDNVLAILKDIENFSDEYNNIGIIGLTSNNFLKTKTRDYIVNRFAYTCVLISDNYVRWTKDLEDDLDYNLQILNYGLCTVVFHKYAFTFSRTESQVGGYTDLYANGKRLQRMKKTVNIWPEVSIRKNVGNKVGYTLSTRVWQTFKQTLQPKP